MELLPFILASLSLLATPGPTNTLLATSGAAAGVRSSLPLLGAEVLGYVLSILTLTLLVGPLIATVPAFGLALRAVVVIYLVMLAIDVWRRGPAAGDDKGPVTLLRVFVTTLLNPKAIIFAFTILPQDADATRLLTWLAVLAMQIVIVGGCWIATGATLRYGLRGMVSAVVGYRISAIALVVLAGGVGAHAFR
jgi:threonine/homoserine/homoserine lactone efflux protein